MIPANTVLKTLALIKELVKRPIQYIHISQRNYFQKARRGEGKGIERLKLIHDITKDKVALIGVGGLISQKDIYEAEKSGFSEFIAFGVASMLNPDYAILLKEGKGDKIRLEIDPEHPEDFNLPKMLWGMSIQEGSLIGFKIKKK